MTKTYGLELPDEVRPAGEVFVEMDGPFHTTWESDGARWRRKPTKLVVPGGQGGKYLVSARLMGATGLSVKVRDVEGTHLAGKTVQAVPGPLEWTGVVDLAPGDEVLVEPGAFMRVSKL